MKNKNIDYTSNIRHLINLLYKNKVIAYPTESVFGLGCNPDSEIAIQKLLEIKNRSWDKGLIMIAANYNQILPYINLNNINNILNKIFLFYFKPITWIIPSKKNVPIWITGKFSSVAIRIVTFKPIKDLCLAFGKPIISTSANISGMTPAKNVYEVYKQFGDQLTIMKSSTYGLSNPSEIRDLLNGKIIRNG